jgi:hypothetical protein
LGQPEGHEMMGVGDRLLNKVYIFVDDKKKAE